MGIESMVAQSHYAVSWLVLLFFLGMAWYVADRSVGYKIYRLWYNWTNKEKLPDDSDVGFIYKRKAKARAAWATSISVLQSSLAVWGSHVNPFYEFVYFFFEVPVIMLGFYAGPILYYIWSRKDRALEKLDGIESGELSLGDEIHKATSSLGASVRAVLDSDDQEPVLVSPTIQSSAQEDVAVEPTIDPYEAMSKFTRGADYGRRLKEGKANDDNTGND